MSGHVSRADSRRLLILARIAKVAIALYLAAWLVKTLASGLTLGAALTGGFGRMRYMATGIEALAAGVGVLVFLPSALAFLIWFHKAISNLHDAGLSGLEARPGWAVGSMFVPFANLIVPYRAMTELWNRSHGEDEWQAKAGVGDVGIWWMGFLVGTLLSFVIAAIVLFDMLTNAQVTAPPGVHEGIDMAGSAFWCLSALFLFRIVGRVTAAQQRLSDDRLAFL